MRPSSSIRHPSLFCLARTTNRFHAVVINAVGGIWCARMVPVQQERQTLVPQRCLHWRWDWGGGQWRHQPRTYGNKDCTKAKQMSHSVLELEFIFRETIHPCYWCGPQEPLTFVVTRSNSFSSHPNFQDNLWLVFKIFGTQRFRLHDTPFLDLPVL